MELAQGAAAARLRRPLRRRAAPLRCRCSAEPSQAAKTLAALDAVLGPPAAAPAPPVFTFEPPKPRAVPEPAWDTPFPVPWGASALAATGLGVGASFLGAGLVSPLAVLLSAPRDALPALPTDADLLAYLSRDDVFWRLLLTSELLQCAGTAGVLLLLARSHSPLPSGVLSLSTARPASWVPQGLVGGAASLGAVALLATLTALAGGRGGGEGASSSTLISHAMAGGPSGWAALVLATVVLAPAFEEVVFRGVLLATLSKWVPQPAAIFLSALAFAAVHGQGLADSAQLLAMGGVAGVVYCRTRTLLAPMAVHATFNGAVLLLYAAWTAGQA